jgi:hypothetical protein
MISTVTDSCLGSMRTLAQELRDLGEEVDHTNAGVCEDLRRVLERTHTILAATRDELVRLSVQTNRRKENRR